MNTRTQMLLSAQIIRAAILSTVVEVAEDIFRHFGYRVLCAVGTHPLVDLAQVGDPHLGIEPTVLSLCFTGRLDDHGISVCSLNLGYLVAIRDVVDQFAKVDPGLGGGKV